MSDEFQITPPTIQAAGTDVPPEQIQSAFNSVCRQTQLALNVLSTQAETPTGPAGGDLGGTYPNPTVVALHVTSGTESGVAITTSTLDSSPVGSTTPSTGAFTTVTATTPIAIASGGTGSGTAAGARTNLGLGTIAVQNANNVAITGGTIDNTPIGQTTTAAGSFTTLTSTGGALNGTVGATTPNTGTFTTLNSTGGALNGSIGATTPNTGSFTTVAASTAIAVSSGGTGRATLTAHSVLIGEGTAAINQTAVGTTGQMLLGVTGADPAFGNNPTITGGTVDNAAVGGTTPAAGAFTTLNASGNDALLYVNTSGQSIPNSTATTVTTWTKTYDRVNANFNASTGVFTAPATGFYHVDAGLLFAANTGAANSSAQVSIVANAVTVASGINVRGSATTAGQGCNVSAVVSLTSGQTVVIQAMQSTGGAVALQTAASFCYVGIHRIP